MSELFCLVIGMRYCTVVTRHLSLCEIFCFLSTLHTPLWCLHELYISIKILCKSQFGLHSADISYWPTATGEYAVHILYNEADIHKSPTTTSAVDGWRMLPVARKVTVARARLPAVKAVGWSWSLDWAWKIATPDVPKEKENALVDKPRVSDLWNIHLVHQRPNQARCEPHLHSSMGHGFFDILLFSKITIC